MVTMMALAHQHPRVGFATFDPGMMPGTGLVRAGPWWARAGWSAVLPLLVPLLDDASTPVRSARAARALLLERELRSGEVYGHDGGVSQRVWQPARRPELVQRVLEESVAFLSQRSARHVVAS
jgi:hypothetical protein